MSREALSVLSPPCTRTYQIRACIAPWATAERSHKKPPEVMRALSGNAKELFIGSMKLREFSLRKEYFLR
jgi:hypothetical protein